MCVQQGVQIAFVAFVCDFESNRGPSCHHGVCVSVRAAGGPDRLCGVCA